MITAGDSVRLRHLFGPARRCTVGRGRQSAASAAAREAAREVKGILIIWSLAKEGCRATIAAAGSKSQSLSSMASSHISALAERKGTASTAQVQIPISSPSSSIAMERRQIETVTGLASSLTLLLLFPFFILSHRGRMERQAAPRIQSFADCPSSSSLPVFTKLCHLEHS